MTLNDAISKAYTKEDLIALYDVYFRDWLEKGWVKLPRNSPFLLPGDGLFSVGKSEKLLLLGPKQVYNIQKRHFTPMLLQFFADEKVFKTIYETLPTEIQTLLARSAFEHQISLENMETDLLEPDEEKLKKEYRLLNSYIRYSDWTDELSGYLHLHTDIIKAIKPWLPKPENYYLNPVELRGKLMQSDLELDAVSNLHRYRDFIATQMKYSKNGSILKSSYKKLHTNLNVQEFYSTDKRIEFMRSEILTGFLDALKDDLKEPLGNAEYLKEMIKQLIHNKIGKKLSLSSLFESHLKGCSSYYDSKELIAEVFQTLGTLMKLMPAGEWIGFHNIIHCMFYRDLQYTLKNDYYNCYVTTYRPHYYDDNEYYAQRTEIVGSNIVQYVAEPLYKGLMFLMASLGFVKLAYTTPFGDDPTFKDGTLSHYDGLVAVQITKLGQYAFRIIDEYDEPESIQSAAVITLNDQRLLITLKGDDPIKQFTVESLAVKRTGMLYQFDYETLYKGEKSAADVTAKLTALFKIVEGEIPANWKALETEVTARLNPLKQRSIYVVLELNHDIDLLKVLATDSTLKKLIIKAENYMIVAKKTDVSAIKQRLRKYGYFFESR